MRHSDSRSYGCVSGCCIKHGRVQCQGRRAQVASTSMSKSLSILTASPNRLMYWARLANCHMLRSFCRVLGSVTGASTSISSAARFREGMSAMPRVRRRVRLAIRRWRRDEGVYGVCVCSDGDGRIGQCWASGSRRQGGGVNVALSWCMSRV